MSRLPILLLVLAEATAPQGTPETLPTFSILRSGVAHVGQLARSDASLETPTDHADMKWLGTAFLVDSRCTFASAKHILSGADRTRLIVRFPMPQDRAHAFTATIRVLYESPTTDLLFLRVDTVNDLPCESGPLHVNPLAKPSLLRTVTGEAVIIIGHPVLSEGHELDFPVLREGVVASSEFSWSGHPMLLLDLVGVPGFSGSPVILKATGTVIGIVFGPGPTRREFGFEWATPISGDDYIKATDAEATGRP
jgi:hypothetical protein